MTPQRRYPRYKIAQAIARRLRRRYRCPVRLSVNLIDEILREALRDVMHQLSCSSKITLYPLGTLTPKAWPTGRWDFAAKKSIMTRVQRRVNFTATPQLKAKLAHLLPA